MKQPRKHRVHDFCPYCRWKVAEADYGSYEHENRLVLAHMDEAHPLDTGPRLRTT